MSIIFKENEPYLEEVCIKDIIDSNKTPFYLYSQKIIIDTYHQLKNDLNSEIFFAIKANSNQAILKLINQLGAGADVVSIGELKRALSAGFEPSKIIFEGVGKSKEDIEFAINKKIRLINAESINEIIMIDEISRKLNTTVNIGVRLNPNVDAKTLDKISTGRKTDKFGINIEKLEEVIKLIQSLKGIKLKGISCHIGSQLSNIKIFENTFEIMKKAAEYVLSNDINLEHVDLGGGFAVNYEQDVNDLNTKKIGEITKSIFKNCKYNVSFEPGRYLVAKSGFIITKILSLKKNSTINFLITDAGMQTLLRPSMYGAKHRVQALNNLGNKLVNYTIAGPICESSDIILKDIRLPSQKINNYLIINDVGAYGSVMSSNYNSRGFPSEILIHKNNFCNTYEGQNISEIIQQYKIPDWI